MQQSQMVAVLSGLLLVSTSLTLSSCAAPTPPPATAKFIEGDWRCLTTSEDGNAENEYTYHLRVDADHLSIGEGRTGDELYWSQLGYALGIDGTLTTYPEDGGPGWVLQLPKEVSYDGTNNVRIAEGWAENLEVQVAEASVQWSGETGLDWACERGSFKDDGNTFIEG